MHVHAVVLLPVRFLKSCLINSNQYLNALVSGGSRISRRGGGGGGVDPLGAAWTPDAGAFW